MLVETLQDIGEVGVRVDVMEFACRDQALDDADMFGTQFGPAEKPVLPTHGDGADGPFEMIGVGLKKNWGQTTIRVSVP